MNEQEMLNEGRDVFAEECRDLLCQMETALLQLEAVPDDQEAVHGLFRAAHTIKGSAGLFGFDGIVRFTHAVETVLDRVREGNLAMSGDLLEVLLPSCDHIQSLVESALGADEADAASREETGEALLARLARFHGGAVQAVPREAVAAAPAADRPAGSSDPWHLSLRFGRECLRNGMDPLSFIRYLGTLGSVVGIATVADALPEADAFDPEACYLGFEIRLQTGADRKAIEDVFEFVRDDCAIRIVPPDSDIQEYLDLMESLPENRQRIGEILVACGALSRTTLEGALSEQQKNTVPPRLGTLLVETGVVQQEVVDAALDRQRKVALRKTDENRFIRVGADKLDQLITLVGELVIAGAGSNALAQRTHDAALLESTARVNLLTEEIRDASLRLRMVQIGETFSRFHRVVRDMSRSLNKDIALEIAGAETELDKTVVEKIGDPLTHLVRNAIDHGIEPADARERAGKPGRARIRLNAYHDSGSIVIEVSDDGRGLDRERILAKARERGLVAADRTPHEDDIFNLIFEPGFSTAERVSDLSGRGVGMDVVKKNIEALQGHVALESRAGQGTTVRIRLPLTLAVIDGFLVQIGSATYVLPLEAVVECVERPVRASENGDYLNLRGKVLPYLRLRDVFGCDAPSGPRESVVVVQCGAQKAGIVVDKLLGEGQTVIKPLGSLFGRLRGISGASILGTGEVALILDVPGLLQLVHSRQAEQEGPRIAA